MLSAEQMAAIMQRYRDSVIAERERCDAIRAGKIKPLTVVNNNWNISDRH